MATPYRRPGVFRGSRTSSYLSGLELRNFKSVRASKVEIGALTIVAGSNSAGKSSLLQAILALTQVSRRRIEGHRFPLNDDLLKLGTFDSLRHQHAATTEPVVVAAQFMCDPAELERNSRPMSRFARSAIEYDNLDRDAPFDADWYVELDSTVADQVGSAQIAAIKSAISGSGLSVSAEVKRSARSSRIGFLDPYSAREARAYEGAISFVSSDGFPKTEEIKDAALGSGQIIALFVEPPDIDEQVSGWFEQLDSYPAQSPMDLDVPYADMGEAFQREFIDMAPQWIRRGMFGISGPHMEWYKSLREDERGVLQNEVLERVRNLSRSSSLDRLETEQSTILEAAQRTCARFLADHVRYVGPLRHAPHLPFGTAPDPDAGDVGISGEHTAAILQAKGLVRTRYPLPPAQEESDRRLTLNDAVNEWLHFFGLAEKLAVHEGTPLVYGINVTPPGLDQPVALGAVGVGVSQILPVIVQCLVAGPGTLIVLEQPELHLHPAAQQRLADFLRACTDWGQRILVETHSEHFVLRLRRRIAEDESNDLGRQIVILFAERDEAGDTAYRKVELSESGGVIDWPAGFFDQGPNEALELLAAAARRQDTAG